MNSFFKRTTSYFVSASFVILMAAPSARAANSEMKEFLLNCGYGTAVGALVGLASLAFSNDPGGSTSNVARGASLGLYAGIAYGIYDYYNYDNSRSSWSLDIKPESSGVLYTFRF